MLHGGQHERGRRAGTENVAGAVGWAARRNGRWRTAQKSRDGWEVLRDRLERMVLDRVAGTHVNGAGAPRTSNTSNMRFDGIDSEPLLIALDLRGIRGFERLGLLERRDRAVACADGDRADEGAGRSSVRYFAGPRRTTVEQVDALIDAVVECVAH